MLQANRKFLAGAPTLIASGEGDTVSYRLYTGHRTQRALRTRLTNERASGDRHAQALICCHATPAGESACLVFDDDDEQHVAGPPRHLVNDLHHFEQALDDVLRNPDRSSHRTRAVLHHVDRARAAVSTRSAS